MGIGVHWNTSTLKAQYDATNAKAIITNPCDRCTAPPTTFTVTFADVLDADCCEKAGNGAYLSADVAQYLNGEHTLTFYDYCYWQIVYSGALGDYGNVETHVEADCSGVFDTDQFDEMTIRYHVEGATSAYLYVWVNGDFWYDVFHWDGAIPSGDCQPSAAINNESTACGVGQVTHYICDGGTAEIVGAGD